MQTKVKATVVYLRKEDAICLARKKKAIYHDGGELSYSLGTWNGYGGKSEAADADIKDTAIRELLQESTVTAEKDDLVLAADLHFFWENNNTDVSDMEVFFYFCDRWVGEPQESVEMGPSQFFTKETMPYEEMMKNDMMFMPKILTGEVVIGAFYFNTKDEKGMPAFKSVEQVETGTVLPKSEFLFR